VAQQAQIVAELKRSLKECGVTYNSVAKRLNLSLASVKRLFAAGDFTLERVDAICDLIGMELSDVLERAQRRALPGDKLTLAQEQQIIAEPKLFLVTWLVLNRTSFADMIKDYRFTERELQRYLIRLDRLRVIELQPLNKVRLLIGRHFSWRPGGPVQNYIHQKLIKEFLHSQFVGPDEEVLFHGGAVSKQSFARLQRTLRNAARECIDIIERDDSPPEARHGSAFLLAARAWRYSGFVEFLRVT
jgi:Cro/C1-type helix-turn-helix DNA-binding protein